MHEFKTRGPVYRRTVQTTLKASYTNHYRRGLIRLLAVLEFRSSNLAHRPVSEALALVTRYVNAGNTTYYPLGETVPVHKAMGGDRAEVVHRADKRGRRRVVRVVYEVVAFQARRDQLTCKEIWVVGADKWRNPDEDLPQDFEARRAENYRELRKPLDAAVFVDELREQMTAELALLNDRMPKLSWLLIAERKSGAIRLTAAEAQPEPRNLRRIKAEVQRRWGIVPLVATSCGTCGAGIWRRRPPALSLSRSRTPPSPPAAPICGGGARRRSPPTPRTCVPTTRTCSPSGTRATAAVGCSSTGTWRRSPRPSTPS